MVKNYRPVSNLTFLSKVEYLAANDLLDPRQSAYRAHHSTETTLVKVQSDLLMAVDGGCAAFLVLLDLSAAFDTIDHNILLSRLHTTFGISDVALAWISSYLRDRVQCVQVKGVSSSGKEPAPGSPTGFRPWTTPFYPVHKTHLRDSRPAWRQPPTLR